MGLVDKIMERFAWLGQPDARPPLAEVAIVPFGAVAPELRMLPADVNAAAIVRDVAWPFAEGRVGQVKIDGYGAIYLGGSVQRIVTREGVPLDCAIHALPALQRVEEAFGRPMMLDMEYAEEAGFDATARAYKRGEGAGVCWLYDAVPLAEWMANRCTVRIEDRLNALAYCAPQAGSPFVGFLRPHFVGPGAMVEAWVKDLWARGYEGAVLKRARSLYIRKRSTDWLRWKERITIDCPVADVLVKDNVFKGLIVRGPGGPIRVTSGFSERDRSMVALANNQVPAHVVEITYDRKAGDVRPRHARFVRWRPEKEGR